MGHKYQNYLKTHRRRWGFTQRELGFLLGCKTAAKVSRFERRSRSPNLRDGLAYELILGVDVRDLLPALRKEVQKIVNRRALLLYEQLQKKLPTHRTKRKLNGLKAIIHGKAREHIKSRLP